MEGKAKVKITDEVADTLFITLYSKAIESKKKNPLIVDQSACDLVEKIDYPFLKYKNSKRSFVGVALRATHFDDKVKAFIQTKENPIVVLLGCGLDARYQRLGKVAKHAQFYELDLPEVIDLRNQLIPPQKNETYMACSMFDIQWMDDIKKAHPKGNFIFVIEGVLMYFSEEENKLVLTEIAKRFRQAEIHADFLNKWLSNRSSMHDTVKKTKAKFNYGIDNVEEIESWHDNLQVVQSYLFTDLKGWKRMGWITTLCMSIIPVIRTSSRLVHLQVA